MGNKIWYVKSKYGSGRYYRSENAFLEGTNSVSNLNVTVYGEIESGKAGDIYNSIVKQKERDCQLDVILGTDEFSQNYMNLYNMYNNLVLDSDNNKRFFIKKFKIIGTNKKLLSIFLSDKKKYFLLQFNSVEWYKTLLLCHNFTTIENFVGISQVSIDNFKEAKRLIKIEKLENKKRDK